jgi:hypothetical protein
MPWTPQEPSGHSLYKRAVNGSIKNKCRGKLMRIVPHILGAAIAAALISTPVFAAELTGTLKKINDSGTITLGHRDSSIPFSYIADGSASPWATPTTFSWPSLKP